MKKRLITGFLIAFLLGQGPMGQASDIRIRKIKEDEILETIEAREYRKLFSTRQLGVYKKAGTDMLPLRMVAEKLGFKVKWNPELRQVDIVKNSLMTSLKAGENYYFFSRMAPIRLSHAPENKDGLVYVPIEFFKEVLGENIIIAGADLAIIETRVEEVKKEDMELEGFVKEIFQDEAGKNPSMLLGVTSSDVDLEEIRLYIVDETEIDYGDRQLKSIKIGDKIKALTPRYMTMSLPPQTTSKKLEVSSFMELENRREDGINYPFIKELDNKVVKSKFNQMVDDFIKDMDRQDFMKDLKMDYRISSLNDRQISLIFRGSFKHLNKETELVKSLNMDLETGRVLDYKNYFKQDRISRDKLEGLLRYRVREDYGREFEAEGLNIYLTEKHLVVYYYELDDGVRYPVEIYLSHDEIKDLVAN